MKRPKKPFAQIPEIRCPVSNVSLDEDLTDMHQTPEEVPAMILRKMKVLPSPPIFTTLNVRLAWTLHTGLKILRLINEPTTAAIAYILCTQIRAIVYGLDGVRLDVSLVLIHNSFYDALATRCNTHLGEEEFDNRVMDPILEMHMRKTGVNISKALRYFAKLTSIYRTFVFKNDVFIHSQREREKQNGTKSRPGGKSLQLCLQIVRVSDEVSTGCIGTFDCVKNLILSNTTSDIHRPDGLAW